MQPRPLDILADEFNFISPFERFMFGASRSYYVYTEELVFVAADLPTMLWNLGFDDVPFFDNNGQDHYPVIAPTGSHPKTYLKWGMEQSRSNHIVLELGDMYNLVHVDIKQARRGGVWHIDAMRVHDAGDKFYVPCDDMAFKYLGQDFIFMVRDTVERLNQDCKQHEVCKIFHGHIQSLVEKMKSVSLPVDHRDMYNPIMPSDRQTTFTP